jgi:hypothetical protein
VDYGKFKQVNLDERKIPIPFDIDNVFNFKQEQTRRVEQDTIDRIGLHELITYSAFQNVCQQLNESIIQD